jgi:myosin-crossreactive antigen
MNSFLASKYHVAMVQPRFSEHFLNHISTTSFVLDALDNTKYNQKSALIVGETVLSR